MKKSQRQRVAVQLHKIEAAVDFDELGALHDELKAGSHEKADLRSVGNALRSCLEMLNILSSPK